MPVSAKLAKRTQALRKVPMQVFCDEVREYDFDKRFAQPGACSIEQYQFLKLVWFFSGEGPRADTKLRQESKAALQRYGMVLKLPGTASRSVLGDLLEKRDAIVSMIYNLGDADVDRLTGMSAQAAQAYIEAKVEARKKNLATRLNNVETQIAEGYLGLVTQPPTYSGPYMCDQLVHLMGPSLKGWRLIRYLGGGEYGKVFQMQSPTGDVLAVKLVVEKKRGEVAEETRAQGVFHGLGLAPRVREHKVVRTLAGAKMHLIVMENIDMTLEEMLCVAQHDTQKIQSIADQVVDMMDRMRTAKVTHGDMHTQNIGYQVRNGKYEPILIDFGQSSTKSNNPLVDAEQLLRTLSSPNIANYPYSHVFADALQRYLDRIGKRYDLTGDDKVQKRLWNRYCDFERNVLSDDRRRALAGALADMLDTMQDTRPPPLKRRSPKRRSPKRRSPKRRSPKRRSSKRDARNVNLIRQLM